MGEDCLSNGSNGRIGGGGGGSTPLMGNTWYMLVHSTPRYFRRFVHKP